jgi:hypothetical protein
MVVTFGRARIMHSAATSARILVELRWRIRTRSYLRVAYMHVTDGWHHDVVMVAACLQHANFSNARCWCTKIYASACKCMHPFGCETLATLYFSMVNAVRTTQTCKLKDAVRTRTVYNVALSCCEEIQPGCTTLSAEILGLQNQSSVTKSVTPKLTCYQRTSA